MGLAAIGIMGKMGKLNCTCRYNRRYCDRMSRGAELATGKKFQWRIFRQKSRATTNVALAFALAFPLSAKAFQPVQFNIEGGDLASVRAASGLLSLEADATNEEIIAAARAEYARIVGALYAEGYYSPVVSVRIDGREAAEIAPLATPSAVQTIAVRVTPGPAFQFGRVSVSPLAPGTTLPADFQPGELARSVILREAAAAGVDGWRNIGHAKAKVSSQDIEADHTAHLLTADIGILAGPKLRFGAVAVAGQERTRENRVRKIAGIPQGETYSPTEIARAELRLRRTGTFASVAIEDDEDVTAPDLLGTTIQVVEEKPRRLSFGAELSSLDGAEISASWLHRNLFRGAERFEITGSVSNIGASNSGSDYKLGVSIDRPATLTPDTTLRFSTNFERLDETDYTANQFDLTLGFTHYFSEQLTAGLNFAYNYENGFAISSDGSTREDFLYRSLAMPLGIVWDNRDSKTDPTGGYYVDAEVKPFLGFGTTDSGVRFKSDLRAYRGFGEEKRLVLAARLQMGAVLGTDILDTPRDDLFYSGGGGTVRGQPYQSLGVSVARSGTTYKVGGTHFVGGSVEARVRATPKIGIVGFLDAGQVGVGSFSGDFHAGAGVGLRYETGLGPIRFDVAAPIAGNTGSGLQIYVGLGQAF